MLSFRLTPLQQVEQLTGQEGKDRSRYESELAILNAKLQESQNQSEKQAKLLEARGTDPKNQHWELKNKLAESERRVQQLREELAGQGERLEWTAVQRFEADQPVSCLVNQTLDHLADLMGDRRR
jgi:septal ring factor EnvC (AmiA/AmiB activator)